MGEREQAAIEAVAGRFSATVAPGDGPAVDAWLTIAGARVGGAVAAIDAGIGEPAPRPRLRFDKVALRLVADLRAALSPSTPEDCAVILTVTAPIRLASKTAAELAGLVRERLGRPSAPADLETTVCGNHIRVRLAMGVSARAPKVFGFVHNPDPAAADGLLRATQSLLVAIGAAAQRGPAKPGERWLVLSSQDGRSSIEIYRQVHAQLPAPADFAKILMVFAGGRVEDLAA